MFQMRIEFRCFSFDSLLNNVHQAHTKQTTKPQVFSCNLREGEGLTLTDG